MIVVFPLLTDDSISQHIMPGICKSLEKFLLIYEMDAISRMLGAKIISVGGVIASKALAKMKPQNESFIIDEARKPWDADDGQKKLDPDGNIGPYSADPRWTRNHSPGGTPWPTTQGSFDADERDAYEEKRNRETEFWKKHGEAIKWKEDEKDRESQRISNNNKNNIAVRKFEEDEIDRAKQRKRDLVSTALSTVKDLKNIGTVQFDYAKDTNSLSLEPTYISVNTAIGTRIIGIKVIPVSIKNTKGRSLAEMMVSDLSMNYWTSKLTGMKRKLIRTFWAICRGVRIPYGNGVITGDPEKDILLASTFHRRYVFCLLNFSDITNSEFFRNAGGIHKLHGLGWNSIIAADDVNKRVIWCMKQFHGLCSSTPYAFIASSFGRDNAKAFTDLDNVKKTANAIFFKTKFSINKLFTEAKTLNNYLKGIK